MGARPEVGGQLIGRRPTLIVAEVVFAYIEEAQVNEMLSTLSDFFLDSGTSCTRWSARRSLLAK